MFYLSSPQCAIIFFKPLIYKTFFMVLVMAYLVSYQAAFLGPLLSPIFDHVLFFVATLALSAVWTSLDSGPIRCFLTSSLTDHRHIRYPRRVSWGPMFLPHCRPFLEALTGQHKALLSIASVYGIQCDHQLR